MCNVLTVAAGEQEGRNPTMVNFASGTAAAVCATLVTQPADVIRTRMQLVAAKGTHVGPMQTLHTVLQTGGPQALLVGTLPRVGLIHLSAEHLLICEVLCHTLQDPLARSSETGSHVLHAIPITCVQASNLYKKSLRHTTHPIDNVRAARRCLLPCKHMTNSSDRDMMCAF